MPKSEPIEEGKQTAEKPDVGDQERQFLLALARSKDLERQLAIAKEDKVYFMLSISIGTFVLLFCAQHAART